MPQVSPVTDDSTSADSLAADFYLLGTLPYSRVITLQRQLAYEVGDLLRPRLAVLLCEHTGLITVGRDGSRAHIRLSNEQLLRAGVQVQWASRGGGCVPHVPGQLAVYAIVPLALASWTVGEYLRRLQQGLQAAIEQFNVHTAVHPKRFGIWGQTGLLAAVGVSVRSGVTGFGASLNVHPVMNLFHHVDSEPPADGSGLRATMSSLLAERRQAVTMSSVRAAVVERLAASFGCSRYQIHAAHPSLHPLQELAGESCTRL